MESVTAGEFECDVGVGSICVWVYVMCMCVCVTASVCSCDVYVLWKSTYLHVMCVARGEGCVHVPYSRESPPTPQRAPTPHFWLNFLYRVKVYSNERPPSRYSLVPRVTGDGAH